MRANLTGWRFTMRWRSDGPEVTVERRLALSKSRIQVADHAAFREFVALVKAADDQSVLLEQEGAAAPGPLHLTVGQLGDLQLRGDRALDRAAARQGGLATDKFPVVKLVRAFGGCLGTKRR